MTADFQSGPSGSRVDLASAPDFDLGAAHVSPAHRRLTVDGRAIELEPRVMRVLVALAMARPKVVSRDQLVETCWDGRIVSDDAVNRCVLSLRNLARGHAPELFSIETVRGVGYSLVGPAALPTPDRGSPRLSEELHSQRRRVLVGAAAAAVLTGLGGAGWWAASQRLPKPARTAIEAGMAAFRQSTPDQMTQAIAAFKRAATLAPRHAQGWALLAMAYRYQSISGAPADEARSLAQRVREAANRALSIEPDNVAAQAALVTIRPSADWVGTGRIVSALVARHPRDVWANWMGVDFYTRTGQLDLALLCDHAVIAADPGWPKLYSNLANVSWCLGQLEAADDWIARGVSQWPRYNSLWFTRHRLFTYTGRAAQALAIIEDRARRPVGIPEWNFDLCRLESQALLTHAPTDVAAAMAGYRAAIPRGAGFAQNAVQFFSAIGRRDDAFAVLETLLADPGQGFGGSRYSTEQGEYYAPDRRDTWFLWMPQLAAIRSDLRMLPLLRNVGLTEYWRSTGVRPSTPIAGL